MLRAVDGGSSAFRIYGAIHIGTREEATVENKPLLGLIGIREMSEIIVPEDEKAT